MGGGGPSQVKSTTTQSLPSWAVPIAKLLLGSYAGQVFPGSDMGGTVGGTTTPGKFVGKGKARHFVPGKTTGGLPSQPVAQMPPGLNQQVAPFTPDQLAAFRGVEGQTGPATQLATAGASQIEDTLSGKFLDPSTNPFLQKTFEQAARGVTDQYRLATAPSLQVAARQAGVSGGSAENQQRQFQEFSLGQNLNNLATDIFGGNYQAERARQFGAEGQIPQAQAALYTPAQEELGVGTLQQTQQQTVLDNAFKNALRATQFPFQLLGGLGGVLGQATGGGGTSVTTGNNPGAVK